MAITTTGLLPRDDYNWTKNPIPVSVICDDDPTANDVRIALTIGFLYYGGTWRYVTIDEPAQLYSTDDGIAFFDLAGLLDEAMANEYTPPSAIGTGVTIVAAAPMFFDVVAYLYVDDVITDVVNLSQVFSGMDWWQAYKGGLANEALGTLNYWQDVFHVDDPDQTRPFLTWQHPNRLVDKNELLPLYYLNHDLDGERADVRLEVYEEAGLITSVLAMWSVNLTPGEIIQLYAGWEGITMQYYLDLVGFTGTVKYWRISLENHGTGARISNYHYFYLDNNYRRDTLYLSYQNSLNGFDDIRFCGEQVKKSKFDREQSVHNQVQEGASPVMDHITRTYHASEQHGRKISTGYLTRFQADQLRELLMSVRIYEKVGTRMLPIVFTDKTKDLLKTSDYLNGVTLEYEYAWTNEVFTPNSSIE